MYRVFITAVQYIVLFLTINIADDWEKYKFIPWEYHHLQAKN
jgi:hypothetical protein